MPKERSLRFRDSGWWMAAVLTLVVFTMLTPWQVSLLQRVLWSVMLVAVGLALALYTDEAARSNHGQLPSHYYTPKGRREAAAVCGTVFLVILIGLGMSALSRLDQRPELAGSFLAGLWSVLLEDAGAPFAVFLGAVSLLGVLLTFSHVRTERQEIHSFAEFLNRAKLLIEATRKPRVVRFMSLTPASGCLVLEERIWRSFTHLLKDSRVFIELTTLDEETTARWFDNYLPEGPPAEVERMKELIRHGREEVEAIVLELSRQATREPDAPKPYRGTWTDLSHSYFLANDDKAIIVSPFFVPSHEGNPFLGRPARVELIGFETADVRILEAVHSEITARRQAIEQREG